MRLGMYVDMRNPPAWRRDWASHYARWLDRIDEADRLGAEMVWLTEHHFFDDGYLPQCWTMAAAIAARTRHIRIGTAVALLPLHSSIETAEQIALADVISDGRIEPGFGVGYRKPEYRAFEGDFKHRYGVFAQRIRELRQLWGEIPGVQRTVTPAPVQSPMPMWGGFGGPMGARTAGRLGLGLQNLRTDLVAEYLTALEEAGHDSDDARVAGSVEFFVSDDPERTWSQIAPHVLYRYESYNRYMFEGTSREGTVQDTHFDLDEIRRGFVIGTPEQIVDAISGRTADVPATDIYCWSDYPGMPDDLIDEHIALTFTRVAPLLR